MAIKVSAFTRASAGLNELALAFKTAGDEPRADQLFQAAADVELASDQLQQCWGGPLNGQTGRQKLVLDLLAAVRPAAIVETGTFRGISTEWFATHFAGPVHSCEIQQMYLLQARHRLAGRSNVALTLQDSLSFLADLSAGDLARRSLLFYLDAHWENDLPLCRELQLIFERFESPVVCIDDFRVPDDPGYGWDDYGANGAITIPYLADLQALPLRYHFPTLPAAEETGARRGMCIVALAADRRLDGVAGLKGGSWQDWTAQGAPAPGGPSTGAGDTSGDPRELPGSASNSYPAIIQTLTEEIEMLRGVCQERLELIERLHAECQRLNDADSDYRRTIGGLSERLRQMEARARA